MSIDAWGYTSQRMLIAQHDFGSWDFRLIRMSEAVDQLDGALGMDFFRTHAIYFDFLNQVAYISP